MSAAYQSICWPTIGQHTDQHYRLICSSEHVGRLSVNLIARHIGQHVDQESAEMIDWESAKMSTDMATESQLTYQLTCQSSIGR